jgi:hypothetical protein
MGGVWWYFCALRHAGRGRVRAAVGALRMAARDAVELAREVSR